MFRDRRAWLAAALLSSLALNVFLGGILSGRWFASYDPIREAAARAPSLVARFRALPADERSRFDAVYEPHRQEVIAARQTLRAARLRAFGALGAPIYDQQVMRQEFEAVRHATEAAQLSTASALIPAFATLTPRAREILAGVERPQGP